ncbi:MAG TPA: RNA polymerase sigma factor region1.1 domain-containing protein, partial [Rhodospirillales bacterium]
MAKPKGGVAAVAAPKGGAAVAAPTRPNDRKKSTTRMASKATATAETTQPQTESNDSPLLDTLNAEIKKMIAKGKERGYVTYDELNAALPTDQVSSEQIEDTMSMLSEAGVNVVESEEGEEPEEEAAAEREAEPSGGNVDENEIGRSDDPVRMYLREMGSVELLSREGEIAIAKRIEAGRDMMIGGIVESPMTIRALLQWRDALDDGLMLLRDIIDLDATYAGPKVDGDVVIPPPVTPIQAKAPVPPPQREAPAQRAKVANDDGEGVEAAVEEDDEDDDNTVSLAVMEQTLLPAVLEKFDAVKKVYTKLHRAQDKKLSAIRSAEELTTQGEKRLDKLRRELIELMQGIHLNNN